MLDLDNLDLGDIAEALADQFGGYEHLMLIDAQTGETVHWSADTGIDGHNPIDLDELLEERELTAIHPLPSWVWYQDMADFAMSISDEQAGRRLEPAIRGKGAFRRFKDELHEEYPDLLPVWYEFRDTRALRRAVEWLAEQSLIDDAAAERYLAPSSGDHRCHRRIPHHDLPTVTRADWHLGTPGRAGPATGRRLRVRRARRPRRGPESAPGPGHRPRRHRDGPPQPHPDRVRALGDLYR